MTRGYEVTYRVSTIIAVRVEASSAAEAVELVRSGADEGEPIDSWTDTARRPTDYRAIRDSAL